MAKHFAKLDNSDSTIDLRDNSSTVVGKKVLNIVEGHDTDDEASIATFMNDGHAYKEYWTEDVDNPRGKGAFIDGYYIPSLDKFTNVNTSPNTWKLDGTDLIYGPPEPWPLIDFDLTDNDTYYVIWEENPNRMIRKQIDADGNIITPEVVQVYNTTTQTWEAE